MAHALFVDSNITPASSGSSSGRTPMGIDQAAPSDGVAEELERARQAFASLLAVMPVAIVATDLETAVTSWNPAAESLFGYSREEAIGRNIDDLIADRPDLRAEAAVFKAEAERTGRVQDISRRMRKDGSLVDVEVLAARIEIKGKPAGYYAIYHDVSELHRQKQYYESLLETSPAAIMTVDRDGIVTSWNPAAERLLGYSRQEAIGRPMDDLVANRPELRDEASEVSRLAREGGQVHLITRRTRKDGSLVDVDLVASAIVVGGEPVGYYAIYSDISELQRQKLTYASLLELSPTAIATVDRDDRVTSWNAAAEQLFGYTREEAMGRNIDDLVAGNDELHAEANAISRQATEGPVQLITRRTRKDGSLVDVDLRVSQLIVGGEWIGLFALYHDISELQRQKQYYSSLLELSPTAVLAIDLEAQITSWNAAAEELFGYTAQEAIGRNVDDVVAQDKRDRDEAIALTERGLAGQEVHLVTQRRRRDGSVVDLEVRAAPIVVGGEQVGFYVIYHDISELQRQRRYYEALVQWSPNAIALLDTRGTVTSWNPAAERLFGYSADEAVGRDIDDLVATDPTIREEARAFTQSGIGDEHVHAITRRTRKDGSLVEVEMFGAPVVVGGETVGLYGMYHDISELQRARFEAEAATEAKSAFLATMSHEIRTPMNAVIGMTDLLLRTELDAEQRSFAEVIRTSGEALLSVINDILDFSKIEAGRLDLEAHPFDLRECVESALDLVSRPAAEKNIDLAYQLSAGTPEALIGDSGRLRQILLNLLNNAVKFTEHGEVVVTVDAEPLASQSAPTADLIDRYRLHFGVSDTGIGIPEEQLGRLFQSFSQVDASTTRRYGGAGLGLAISKRLSERMGGTMWVESAPGEGSTFHFTVEAEAGPPPTRAYERADDVPLAGRRVLIIDDNATNRHIVRAYAEAWGMVARDTGTPAEALTWIGRGDPFDVAILDMQMPEMDGVAVARRIREVVGAERLRLILLTSLGRREEDEGGLFAARLPKPIRPSQLYDVLLTVLVSGRSRAPRQSPGPDLTEATERPAHRILVAEDNPMNRQLALLLLEKIGYRADVAANGLEALEAVERDGYAIVLMDVQMPEMDGLEATRKIHERLGSHRPRIIAATANATLDERERCLAAGMDDYLSKPIRIEELAAAIGRQLHRGARAREHPHLPADVAPKRLDRSVLERLRTTLGDAGTGQLIGEFLTQAPKLLTTIRSAADQGDLDDLRRAAHTLKSNGATFGAMELAEISRGLERLAEEASTAGAQELVTRAEREYELVRPMLDAERGRLSS